MALKKYPFYLANQAIYANQDLMVKDKFTNEPFAVVSQADSAVIQQAIEASVTAFEEFKHWPSYRKKNVLKYVVNSIQNHLNDFADLLCIEAGKPIKDARGEIQRSIDTFQLAMEESTRFYGEYMPLDISERAKGYESIWKRFPIGPCSFISPFNFPLNLVAHKVAPAIAVGCPFILKPASLTPLTALKLGEILSETDLPKGAFSILPCTRDGAELFTIDERLKLLSFTGSPDVGWKLKSIAGKKKVVLELGGNAACIVEPDVDLEKVADRIIVGAYYQSGQSCISVQRIYIHETIYKELTEILIQKSSQLKVGNPKDENNFMGPMISEKEAIRIESWIDEAVSNGAQILVGGKRQGSLFQATLLENVPTDVALSCQEVFGPVAIIESYDSFKTVCQKVNRSKFGLQAGIFTQNIHHAYYAFNHLDVGGVVINDVPSIRVDNMPYGGVKDSGLGREGIRFAMEDMSEIKVLVLKDIGII